MNTTPILRATNIVKKLGGKTILNDVSLDVHKGDVKVVIGPSGAGKSTFLQCLNYLLPPAPARAPAISAASCSTCAAPKNPTSPRSANSSPATCPTTSPTTAANRP